MCRKGNQPIARRNVAVHSEDGTFSHYTTNSDAYERVERLKLAQWRDDTRKAIDILPKVLTPKGSFEIPWKPRKSGYAGPLVLQMVTA